MNGYKSLSRSRYDKIIGGVAGGMAEYLGMDSAIVRFLFILVTLFFGTGVWIYIILWIILPFGPLREPWNFQTPNPENMENETPNPQPNPSYSDNMMEQKRKRRENSNFITGIILITLGVLFLISELVPHISFSHLWPIVLIVIGGLLLRNYYFANKPDNGNDPNFRQE